MKEPCRVCNNRELKIRNDNPLTYGYWVECSDDENICNKGREAKTKEEAIELWNKEQTEE